MEQYPALKYLRKELRNNLSKSVRKKILGGFIIGSEANGTAKSESDLDIAIIISRIKGKTSIQFTEQYHSSFTAENQKPKWKGRVIDFQFFYEEEIENINYAKIEIQ